LPKRPDLKLIITSATIDPERFSKHFNDAPIIQVSGRTYPVEIRYQAPSDQKDSDQISEIIHAIDQLMHEKPGDILVFLSGERDIRDTQDALLKRQYRATEIVPLFARLSASEQNKIFQSHTGRRIVLATNVAETSLTVPGIKYVIDPGWVRISRYSPRNKIQRLPIEPISQASANQRAGRCGRVSDGICIRLYSEDDFISRPEFTDPEIIRTHLSSVILQMLALGLGEIKHFPFIQPPDDKNIQDGLKLLEELQALTRDAKTGLRLTDAGRKMSRLPIDPRYARMVIEASKNNSVKEVIIVTSGLSIQDPRERPLDKQQAADEKHSEFADKDSDFLSILNLWESFTSEQKSLTNNQLRKWCKTHFIHYMRMREWQDIVSQLKKSLVEIGYRLNSEPADYTAIHSAIASGLLSQIGMKDTNREYLGARNIKFMAFPGSPLSKQQPKWLMAAELVETSKLYARTLAKVDTKWIEPLAQHLVNKNYSEPHWSKKRGAVMAYMTQTLYGIPIVNRRLVNYSNIDPAICREIFVREGLVQNQTQLNYAFLRKNQSLIEEVELLEHKSRRRDILVDEDDLVSFYLELIPEYVCSDVSFKKWWSKTLNKTPDLLLFDPESLLKKDTSSIQAIDYPDHWKQGNLRLPLSYEFEPNSEFDGVCLHIPLPLLNQVKDLGFDWLVPGFRHELVVALIKSLPKRLRRNFVPAPNFADACLADISPVNDNGAPNLLIEQIMQKLLKMTGVRLQVEDFDLSALASHLSFNFAIVDENNQLIERGKSLVGLQEKLSGKIKQTFTKVATPDLERQGLTQWDFDNLPSSFEKKHAGFEIKAFPALVVKNNKVDIVLLDDEQESITKHRLGVYHLIKQTVPSPLKYLQEKLPNKAKLGLYFNPFGQVKYLIDDIIMASIAAMVTELETSISGSIRDKKAFEQACNIVKENINDRAYDIALKIEKGLTTAHSVQKQCKGNIPLNMLNNIGAIKAQLNRLVYKGFVFDLGESRLDDWNRYVKALAVRSEKLKVDLNRDRLNQLEVDKAQTKFEAVLQKYKHSESPPEGLQEVEWMIEELKVSLFAQQLGTAYPISVKRIENKLSEYS
jgi:ATP-dependent helicase HrpA